MALETRTYNGTFASRPVEYDGCIWVWVRVPGIDSVYTQSGRDGDWARFRLYQLEHPAEFDPEEVQEPTVISVSEDVSLEEYGDLEETEPGRVQPLRMADLDFDQRDPHPNPYVALSGQYLLFCPSPEGQLICWDLDAGEEAWRIDSRKPENGIQKVFRILGVRESSGEFLVSFRERNLINSPVYTPVWSPDWGDDENTQLLATWVSDETAENCSPAGLLLLAADDGAENERWESDEIAAESPLLNPSESASHYDYVTIGVENNPSDVTDAEAARYADDGFAWARTFSYYGAGGNLHVNGADLDYLLTWSKRFTLDREDAGGKAWTQAGIRIEGTGIAIRAEYEDGRYQSNVGELDDYDPVRLEFESYGLFQDEETENLGGHHQHFSSYQGGTTDLQTYSAPLNEYSITTFPTDVLGYGTMGESVELYLDEATPGELYHFDEDHPLGTVIDSANPELVWHTPLLANPLDPEGDDSVIEFVVPGLTSLRGASRDITTDGGPPPEESVYVVDNGWNSFAYEKDSAVLTVRRFFGSTLPDVPLPAAWPSHSLVRACVTEYGVVYGPNTDLARADLDLVWRCLNWDGTVRWTRTITKSKSLRQSTVPLCVGDEVITVVQEWADEDPGPVRVVKIDSDTGALNSDTAISSDLFGGLDTEAHVSGVYLHHEAVVIDEKITFRAGPHRIMY